MSTSAPMAGLPDVHEHMSATHQVQNDTLNISACTIDPKLPIDPNLHIFIVATNMSQ